MGDPVTWFDLGAADAEPLKAFYGDLFGWKLEPASEGYTVVRTGGGTNGGIGRSMTGDPWATFYVEVEDPQAALDRAESLGGKTVVPVIEIPDTATFAMFTDPDGLLVGVMKTTTGGEPSGGASSGAGPAVDWFEVLGSDAERAQSFYRELFGWTLDHSMGDYALVDTGAGRGIGGGIGASDSGSRWATVYANVDDVERYLRRAEELGGGRVYGPTDVDDHMQSGALRDPAGNVLGVYYHRPH